MVTYRHIMVGRLGDHLKQKAVGNGAGAMPRSGGQKIKLKAVDKAEAFRLIVQQNKGK